MANCSNGVDDDFDKAGTATTNDEDCDPEAASDDAIQDGIRPTDVPMFSKYQTGCRDYRERRGTMAGNEQ